MKRSDIEKAEGNIRVCVGVAFVLFVIGAMFLIQCGMDILQIL